MEAYVHGLYMRRKKQQKSGDQYLYASVRSRRRRIVLEQTIKKGEELSSALSCKEGLNRRVYLRTVVAAVVDTVHAPPAIVFLHAEQFQMPTARRFTVS